MYVSEGIYSNFLLLLKPLIEDIKECGVDHIIRLGLAGQIIVRAGDLKGYISSKTF